MESIYNENLKTLSSASKKALEMLTNLYDLVYFDRSNYENNIKDFQFVIVNEEEAKLFGDNQVAMYHSGLNKILVKESKLYEKIVDEEMLVTLLFHELIHMASTNRKKGVIGFNHQALPITYNEGCTQYLTLKILYKDNLEQALLNNVLYPQSTYEIKKAVDLLGEEKIFNGFFKADVRKGVDNFSPKELDNWIDTVMVLTNSYEETKSKENFEELSSNVVNYSR